MPPKDPACYRSTIENMGPNPEVRVGMKRRELIFLLGGAMAPVVAWPLAARAQTVLAVRRVGVLSTLIEDTAESRRLMAVFIQGLGELGWSNGRDIRIEQRWSGGDNERLRSGARELASLRTDVVLAVTSPAVAAPEQEAPGGPRGF